MIKTSSKTGVWSNFSSGSVWKCDQHQHTPTGNWNFAWSHLHLYHSYKLGLLQLVWIWKCSFEMRNMCWWFSIVLWFFLQGWSTLSRMKMRSLMMMVAMVLMMAVNGSDDLSQRSFWSNGVRMIGQHCWETISNWNCIYSWWWWWNWSLLNNEVINYKIQTKHFLCSLPQWGDPTTSPDCYTTSDRTLSMENGISLNIIWYLEHRIVLLVLTKSAVTHTLESSNHTWGWDPKPLNARDAETVVSHLTRMLMMIIIFWKEVYFIKS